MRRGAWRRIGRWTNDLQEPLVDRIIQFDAYRNALLGAAWSAGNTPILSFSLQESPSASLYMPTFPLAWVDREKPDVMLRIGTPLATVQLPGNFLSAGDGAPESFITSQGDTVSLSISLRTPSELPAAITAVTGGRPVLDLSLLRNGAPVDWSNPDAPVTVGIPYRPGAEEQAHPERIVIWYVDGSGRATLVPSCRYDAISGMVRFQTTHFSTYAVGYQTASSGYADLSASWARSQVEGLKLRGGLGWVEGNRFEPNRHVTRGEFVRLLLTALGLDVQGSAASTDSGAITRTATAGAAAGAKRRFADVAPARSDAAAIERAAALGIVLGSDGNRFHPDTAISRQDMAVICARAMRCTSAVLKATDARTLNPFRDQAQIGPHARDGLALLVANGILVGSEGNLMPKSNVSRAQAAVIAWRLLVMQ